jgi:hypothetical protein
MSADTYLGRQPILGAKAATAPWEPHQTRWLTLCALLVIPLAAMWHNLFFYWTTCMLNPFGHEYTADVLLHWLSRDPSLPMAMLMAIGAYHLGNRVHLLRLLVAPFLLAFLPLSLWIWDIPFSGRIICENFHDLKLVLPGDFPLRGRHLYVVGAVAYVGLASMRMRGFVSLPGRRGAAEDELEPARSAA